MADEDTKDIKDIKDIKVPDGQPQGLTSEQRLLRAISGFEKQIEKLEIDIQVHKKMHDLNNEVIEKTVIEAKSLRSVLETVSKAKDEAEAQLLATKQMLIELTDVCQVICADTEYSDINTFVDFVKLVDRAVEMTK